MNEKYVQLEIWDLLEEAKLEPLEVEWHLLWDGLDASLIDLEASEQLQVASEALLQMVEVFYLRSMEAFDDLEAYISDDGPVMGDGDFLPFVRQFMDTDFDEFIEPLVNTVRKPLLCSSLPSLGKSLLNLWLIRFVNPIPMLKMMSANQL